MLQFITDPNGQLTISSGMKKRFKSRCMGVLDVTMEDQTHLYVIACSTTGLTDLLSQEMANFAKTWEESKERIKDQVKDIRDLNLQYPPIIADVGSSTQCYRTVPAREVSEFSTDKQEAYWEEIKQRLQKRIKVLRESLELELHNPKLNADQCTKFKKILKESVFRVKFKSNHFPEEEFKELVKWHQDLIEEPDTLVTFFELAKMSHEEFICHVGIQKMSRSFSELQLIHVQRIQVNLQSDLKYLDCVRVIRKNVSFVTIAINITCQEFLTTLLNALKTMQQLL